MDGVHTDVRACVVGTFSLAVRCVCSAGGSFIGKSTHSTAVLIGRFLVSQRTAVVVRLTAPNHERS